MNDIYVKKIQTLKTEYKVKYKDIAERLGVHRSFVSKWLSGVKLIPEKYFCQIDKMMDQMKGGE